MKLKRKVSLAGAMMLSLVAFSSVTYGYTQEENLFKCGENNPYHMIVNKQHKLSSNYKPDNLIVPNVKFASSGNLEKNYMEATAGKALERMFNDAKKQGVTLVAVSGYRSYDRQSQLYNNAVKNFGVNQIGSAEPNASEHRTGLAMDINSVEQSFANTLEGKWLANNCHKYGFIIRYPKGKTNITGYMYEPWHVRYVGEELATYCHTNNLTLEEVTRCCYNEVDVAVRLNTNGNVLASTLIQENGVSYIKAKDFAKLYNATLNFNDNILTLNIDNTILMFEKESNSIKIDGEESKLINKLLFIENTNYLPLREVLSMISYSLNISGNTFVIDSSVKLVNATRSMLDEGETIIRYEDGHPIIRNEYGDEYIGGCSDSCIYGAEPEL